MPPKVLVVCGPTASGKTGLGIALAQEYNGEIVSTDSMQIYRTMDIGTAKPTQAEMAGIPHHMIDVADPGEDFSVARYVQQATLCVDDILSRGKLPILVGGTGMYIDNLIAGREFAPFTGKWRDSLQTRAQAEGLDVLYKELQEIDPDRAEKLHPNDEKRILRALEVFYETGQTITAHDAYTATLPPRYQATYLGLNAVERPDLWARIDQRVDEMEQLGLVEEVDKLLNSGLPPACTALQAIGYKEFAAALRGESSMKEALDEVKLRSRQYAKRQLTWFRRNPALHWLMWEKKPNLQSLRQKATDIMANNGLL